MAKKKYPVTAEKLKHIDGFNYLIEMGQANTGKSFATKYYCIQCAYNKCVPGDDDIPGYKCLYIRRYERDITIAKITSWLDDLNREIKEGKDKGKTHVEVISDGAYKYIGCFRGKIIKMYRDDPDTQERFFSHDLGTGTSVADVEHTKSLVFNDYGTAIFEEFVTDRFYLDNEPDKLQRVISSVFRDDKAKVFLIANKVSRLSPYFRAWQLTGITEQKPDTIDTYTQKNVDTGQITIIKSLMAGEYKHASGMFFGSGAKAITGSEWYTETCRLMRYDKFDKIYRVVFIYDNFKFIGDLCRLPSGYIFWFVYPYYKNINIFRSKDRIVTNGTCYQPSQTPGMQGLTSEEAQAFKLLRDGNVYFSDNLTGTEFNHIYKLAGVC